jgi:hypothetical protein
MNKIRPMTKRCSDEISALQGLCVLHFIEPERCGERGGSSGVTLRVNECNHALALRSNYIGSLRQTQQAELQENHSGHGTTLLRATSVSDTN